MPSSLEEIHLVMEYMAGGELYDRLFQQRVYKEDGRPVACHPHDTGALTPERVSMFRGQPLDKFFWIRTHIGRTQKWCETSIDCGILKDCLSLFMDMPMSN